MDLNWKQVLQWLLAIVGRKKVVWFMKAKYGVGVLFLIAAGIGVFLIYSQWDENPGVVIQYFGFILTSASIGMATIQFRAHHDIERRKMAITEGSKVKAACDDAIRTLGEAFDFTAIGMDSISVDKIHNAICLKNEKGEFIADPDKRGRHLLDYKGSGYKIEQAITKLLNCFEYMAIGVYQHIFDRDVIRALYRGNFCKAYSNFKAYIDHYNNDMAPERKGKVWNNFVRLSEEFIEEDKALADTKKPTG